MIDRLAPVPVVRHQAIARGHRAYCRMAPASRSSRAARTAAPSPAISAARGGRRPNMAMPIQQPADTSRLAFRLSVRMHWSSTSTWPVPCPTAATSPTQGRPLSLTASRKTSAVAASEAAICVSTAIQGQASPAASLTQARSSG